MKLITKEKLKLIFKIIKKYKIIFIIVFCIGLFILGLVRDINKNKTPEYKENSNVNFVYKDTIDIKIIGGVNKDYTGSIEKGLHLFEIIEKYNNGLARNAEIEDIDFSMIINNDYELYIKEGINDNDNSFQIIDYSTISNVIYRYNGRVDGKLIIYIVNEGISEDDYYILTKGNQSTQDTLVNINTATLEELIAIGLGKSKSEKLIEYRNQNGKFTSIEDITKVSGIGEATFEKVKDKICAK